MTGRKPDGGNRPLPGKTARTAPFWEAAERGELAVQRCAGCRAYRFPAVDHCSICLGRDLQWTTASGEGVVFSYVVVHRAMHPYFAERGPYAVVDVKLDEGPHMISSLADCSPDRVEIGARVRIEFEKVGEDTYLPLFRRIAA